MAKPKAECTPGLVKDGHAPAAYEKVYKSKKKTVKAAETLDEEGFGYFYESQGYSYDAEFYNAEYDFQNQAITTVIADEENEAWDELGMKDIEEDWEIVDVREAETATYEPSNEPDMASPATEPTNANFEAEKVRMCASCGSYKNAEGHGCGCMGAESQDATYEPSQEPDMESPATEPTNANFEAQGAYPSLEDFTGTESVVVEPPLGHGVAQWYAETATYEPSSEPDMESPATEPTNANFESESSPSSFDITWEDAQGVSSPSLPPEGIHFAETEEAFGSVGEGNNFGQMRAEHEADFVVEKPFTTGAKLSAGVLTGMALFSVAGALAMGLLGKFMDKEE
jgi:hypothetical protein